MYMQLEDYHRVYPRDLFNESQLLKCLGRLFIEAEVNEHLTVVLDAQRPIILLDLMSGGIAVQDLFITYKGEKYQHLRPVNSRVNYDLELISPDYKLFKAFNQSGEFVFESLD